MDGCVHKKKNEVLDRWTGRQVYERMRARGKISLKCLNGNYTVTTCSENKFASVCVRVCVGLNDQYIYMSTIPHCLYCDYDRNVDKDVYKDGINTILSLAEYKGPYW